MPTKIAWAPIVAAEFVLVDSAEVFILQIQRAFPGEFPLTLSTKHLERLEGMAAADSSVGSPYLALIGHVKRYKQVSIWPEREEKE